MKAGPIFFASLFLSVSAIGADYFDETEMTTLFAFDDISIPYTQNLKLEMRLPERHSENPVVPRGEPGTPDSRAVQFYGSIIRENGKFRMWYAAAGDGKNTGSKSVPWRVAYAESEDGVHWTKPNLGLVEYNGDKDNNLVQMDPLLGALNVKVIRDPDDPDPERLYKMGVHAYWKNGDARHGTLAPYASADGLDWKLLIDAEPDGSMMRAEDLVLPGFHFEPVGGLYKWEGLFHLSGQNAISASRPYHGRVARTFISPDFIHWSPESSIQIVRDAQHELLGPGRSREGEQTHEGISVWERSNVLVGTIGRWHGGSEWKDVTVDLGLVVSNDGIRFREPAHEWVFLDYGEDGEWDQGGLLQGQGFENVGDETFIYYGAWDPRNWEDSPPRGGVGIATLPRDRFADLVTDESTKGAGDYQMEETVCSLMTKPLKTPAEIYVNVDGLGDDARLRIEFLGHDARPIGESTTIATNGFQIPVAWNESAQLPESIRLRVIFEGEERSGIRLSAIYLK